MTGSLTEAALFELLSLECRVSDGVTHYCNAQGQLHREHGPAVECADGGSEWYQNDQLHRLDGPAVIHADGYRAWYQNGLRHRLDGPAVENEYGSCNWFIDDNLLTEAEWRQAIASMGVYSPR